MIIRLNKTIYPESAVKRAIKGFKDLADLELQIEKEYYLVKAENISPEVTGIFFDEFCNFTLGLIKN